MQLHQQCLLGALFFQTHCSAVEFDSMVWLAQI
jgi:hypothetical protein